MAITQHEINLLPPQRRSLLQRGILFATLRRLLRTVLAAVASMTAVALVIMVTLFIMGNISASPTKTQYESTNKQYQDLRDKVDQRNRFLMSIQALGDKELLWSEFLKSLFAAMPSGVTLNSISATSDAGTSGVSKVTKVEIKGQATARDTLGVLENRLRGLPGVSEVDSPTSNLIQRYYPPFTYTLTFGGAAGGLNSAAGSSATGSSSSAGGAQILTPGAPFPTPPLPSGDLPARPFQLDGTWVLIASSILLVISGGILLGKKIVSKKFPTEQPRAI